jgi:type I restriction enzyme, S subunit
MNAATLIDNFDLLAEAPGGVRKLRELILQLAVRGKLVEQREEEGKIHREEPALAKATADKREEGKGKKKIDEPFVLPQGWRWRTLRSVSRDLGQKVPDQKFTYIDVSAIDKERGRIGTNVQVLQPGQAPSRARKLVDVGTVIYSTVRPYLLNIAVIDRKIEPPPIVSTAFFVMQPFDCVDSRFLFYYLRSQPFTAYVNDAMTGMAYPAVNDSKMSTAPFPLPPLAEQKRIVARVDELMKRCDALEARQNERNERHKELVSSCLHALVLKPETRNLTPSNFSSILQPSNFNLLLATPESVAELRKTILQLAVQGRLVPQIADEGPVHHEEPALAKATADKHERGEGKKKIDEPFVLPKGWRMARLGDIGEWGSGSTPSRTNHAYYGGDVPWFKSGELNDNQYLTESGEYVTDMALDECSLRMNERGDVLIAMYGATIGKLAILACRGTTNQAVCACTCNDAIHNRYLFILLKSLRSYFASRSEGAAQPNISKVKIINTPFPLPPLAEQKRIVAKVNELMAMCDALEAKLTKAREDADTLAAAVVHGENGHPLRCDAVLTTGEVKGVVL